MGYRSNVGLALTKEGVVYLNNKLNNLDKDSGLFCDVADMIAYPKQHCIDKTSGAEMYFWTYQKWYSQFPEIMFFENLMNELEPESFYFVRIGEELDDNEVRGSFWDNPFDLGIDRSITFSESV